MLLASYIQPLRGAPFDIKGGHGSLLKKKYSPTVETKNQTKTKTKNTHPPEDQRGNKVGGVFFLTTPKSSGGEVTSPTGATYIK